MTEGTEHGDNSVSRWICGLKAGEAEAARRLWDRYAKELTRIAKGKLGTAPRRVNDEEDIALSVFASLCQGAAEGRFNELQNRDDLWWLMLTMTGRKAINHIRKETAKKRGGWRGATSIDTPGEDGSDETTPFLELASEEPTPEQVAIMAEECERLLGLLRDDRLRAVAMLRIDGYTVAEIAQRLGIGTRAVERKLKLIRSRWSRELEG